MKAKGIVGLLALLALVGGTQGFIPTVLMDELGKIPGVSVVQLNDTACTLVFNSSEIGQLCLSCACDTEHLSESHANSCCKPDCAQQHPGTCEQNNCVWSYDENRWKHNQCKT